jgi:hypothetical protein
MEIPTEDELSKFLEFLGDIKDILGTKKNRKLLNNRNCREPP